MCNKILLISIFLIINYISFSNQFHLTDLKNNKVEIKHKKYVLLTYGELACKQCYAHLTDIICKIDSTIPVYCIIANETNKMKRKISYGIAKNYSKIKVYFYNGNNKFFQYSPNVIIVDGESHYFISHRELFTKNYTTESITKILIPYFQN